MKYGNFAFKLGLIEAGHLAQNLYLMSAEQNLKCCALGGFNEKIIHKLLDIDGATEIAFYAFVAGK
jgi:SagB-type dehydrogenase family enzyme